MESSCAVTQQATGGNRRSAALHAFAGGWYACFFVVGRGRIGCVGMPNTRKVEASQEETPTQNETCLLQKHHRQQLPLLNRTTTRVLQYYIATASSYTVIHYNYCNGIGRAQRTCYPTSRHSEPSYSAQTHESTPANCRGRLSAQNPHTVLSRICMKLDIKKVYPCNLQG